jgi:hypothetical protein
MVAYAVLRTRGHGPEDAAALVLRYRPQAELVPNYVRSVERWLATMGAPESTPASAPAPESAPA